MDKATAKRDDRTADPRAERANVLLKLLVEHYIEKGAPVSSKQLATESALKISSATVRNVMADLEAMGLVTSPHTSAGKVPRLRASASLSIPSYRSSPWARTPCP